MSGSPVELSSFDIRLRICGNDKRPFNCIFEKGCKVKGCKIRFNAFVLV